MRDGIHPDYHKVLFVDTATGDEWLSRSTMTSNEKREIDGEQVPVIQLEISAFSHPFWTGTHARARFRREDRPLPPPLRRKK